MLLTSGSLMVQMLTHSQREENIRDHIKFYLIPASYQVVAPLNNSRIWIAALTSGTLKYFWQISKIKKKKTSVLANNIQRIQNF